MLTSPRSQRLAVRCQPDAVDEPTPAEARWENEGGALEGEAATDLHRRDFSIEAVGPLRLDLTVWALRRRPLNAVDLWNGTAYRRALLPNGAPAEVCVTQAGGGDSPSVTVALTTCRPDRPIETNVRVSIERMLGLRVDLSDFYCLASTDELIGPLAARYRGLKPPRFPTVFESLLNAVACQQLSLEAGLSLLNRLAQTHGDALAANALHAFPSPDDLANLDPQALRDLGFSFRKATTMIELSRDVASGHLDLESLEHLGDKEVVSKLTSLTGIGRWSAEYVLLRGLGRLHVFPGDDVGARNNLARVLNLPAPLDYNTVAQAVSPWKPYAGLVYFHLLLARLEAARLIKPD
jgi:DNA-3-methyladenine glycosylase II